jgi:hypothetical protein
MLEMARLNPASHGTSVTDDERQAFCNLLAASTSLHDLLQRLLTVLAVGFDISMDKANLSATCHRRVGWQFAMSTSMYTMLHNVLRKIDLR